MRTYGLNTYQIDKANKKLEFNKEFMRSNGIQLDDKMVPYSDFVSNSYMNSDRYVAELQHRAWSVFDYAKEKDLKNIFITLTLPSKWHQMKTKRGKLIFNKKFGGRKHIYVHTTLKNKYKFFNAKVIQNIPYIEPELDFLTTVDKYTPRNASKELSLMLRKLFNERSYRSIDKDDRCYFRVTEPHKDGTPHVHMSLFVPADKVEGIVKSVNRLFPAPLSKIETEIDSPVSYLMKYVLKTLDDLRDDSEKITNLTLWYLYHGISRFYTSRTFMSLDVYRKLNGMYTLIDLTKSYLNEDINVYIDTTTKKVVLIENEYGTLYTPKPVNWYDKLCDSNLENLECQYNSLGSRVDGTRPQSYYKPIEKPVKIKSSISVFVDGQEFIIHHHAFERFQLENRVLMRQNKPIKSLKTIMIKSSKLARDMNDLELYTYFQSLDIETCDLPHYGHVRNLLIERSLMEGEIIPFTEYQSVMEF